MKAPILVPLDGSLLAEQALAFAEMFALAGEQPLLLVCASYVAGLPGMDVSEEQVRQIAEAEAYLHKVARGAKKRGLTVETAAPYGLAGPAIIDEARVRGANLIVMATHGRGGLGRLIYGSVAEAVVRDAPVPVLLVRAWHGGDVRARIAAPGAIVAPLDGSALAETALPVARSLASALEAELALVRAVPPPDAALTPDGMAVALFTEDREAVTREANEYLARVAASLADSGIKVTTSVRVGVPASVITAVADERGAALTVLATHARTGLNRFFLGSVAEAIVRQGATPVLLVNPEYAQETALPLASARPAATDGATEGPA